MDTTEISPDEPVITTEKRVWGFWPTFGLGISVIFSGFVVGGLIGIIFGVGILLRQSLMGSSLDLEKMIENLGSIEGLILSVGQFIYSIAGIGLIILFIRMRRGFGITEYLGLKPISARTIVVSLGIMAGFIMLVEVVYRLTGLPGDDFNVAVYETSLWPWLLWLALIIFAPAFEEVLFRGFLFAGFLQSRIGIIGTVILTSLLWTIIHIQYDIYGMAQIFFMGIILGIMRYKTGSLWSPILMHSFGNLVCGLR